MGTSSGTPPPFPFAWSRHSCTTRSPASITRTSSSLYVSHVPRKSRRCALTASSPRVDASAGQAGRVMPLIVGCRDVIERVQFTAVRHLDGSAHALHGLLRHRLLPQAGGFEGLDSTLEHPQSGNFVVRDPDDEQEVEFS